MDTVVVAELAELLSFDMGGLPVAAVEECSQRLDKYLRLWPLDARLVAALPAAAVARLKPDTCVANRGLLLQGRVSSHGGLL